MKSGIIRIGTALSLFIGLSGSVSASTYPEMKKKVATVAVFGLAGAGVGLLSVAASTEPQSRLGNISAGLVLGAMVGTVYVFSTEDQKTSLNLVPHSEGGGLNLVHRF